MKKEFNLSEFVIYNPDGVDWIAKFRVKEFIKNEEFLLMQEETGEITWKEFYEKRQKLIGDGLK